MSKESSTKTVIGRHSIPPSNRPAIYPIWLIDDIEIKALTLTKAIIRYRKNVVNRRPDEKVVSLSWRDKRKGITLSEKVKKVYNELVDNLEKENEEIMKIINLEEELKKQNTRRNQ